LISVLEKKKCHWRSDPTFVKQFSNFYLKCGLRFLITTSEGPFKAREPSPSQPPGPAWSRAHPKPLPAAQEGNTLRGFKDFCLNDGSSQGQNLAVTVLYVPNSFDIGFRGASTRRCTLKANPMR